MRLIHVTHNYFMHERGKRALHDRFRVEHRRRSKISICCKGHGAKYLEVAESKKEPIINALRTLQAMLYEIGVEGVNMEVKSVTWWCLHEV